MPDSVEVMRISMRAFSSGSSASTIGLAALTALVMGSSNGRLSDRSYIMRLASRSSFNPRPANTASTGICASPQYTFSASMPT